MKSWKARIRQYVWLTDCKPDHKGRQYIEKQIRQDAKREIQDELEDEELDDNAE